MCRFPLKDQIETTGGLSNYRVLLTHALVVRLTSRLWRSSLFPSSKHLDYSLFSNSCCYNSLCVYSLARSSRQRQSDGVCKGARKFVFGTQRRFRHTCPCLVCAHFKRTSKTSPQHLLCHVSDHTFPKLKQTLYFWIKNCNLYSMNNL